jgi:hypothetical protein
MKKLALLSLIFLISAEIVFCQTGLQKHNPLLDYNLSPAHNDKINPISNPGINPKYNWNLNPMHNDILNPSKNPAINPESNPSLNASTCQALNPMFANSLHPKNPLWAGNFLFDKDDKLIGFISVACQQILLEFNASGDWTGYFVRSSYGTYNEFSVDGKWTGKFLCPDSSEGYNLFSNDSEWTGEHIK